MKPIIFSKHSLTKIEILNTHGLVLSTEFIEVTVRETITVECGYKNRLIAQKELDSNHVLRVVYEETENELKIITLYPGRKDRYEKH